MKEMPCPTSWDDLWIWFDAHDIYHYGATNLWNVICNLYHENRIVLQDMQKETSLCLGHWADDWVEKPANSQKLGSWVDNQGHILNLLTIEDWDSLGEDLDQSSRILLENALRYRHDIIVGTAPRRTPKDLMSVVDRNLHNWLGNSNTVAILPRL
jgi:hypothetical protein